MFEHLNYCMKWNQLNSTFCLLFTFYTVFFTSQNYSLTHLIKATKGYPVKPKHTSQTVVSSLNREQTRFFKAFVPSCRPNVSVFVTKYLSSVWQFAVHLIVLSGDISKSVLLTEIFRKGICILKPYSAWAFFEFLSLGGGGGGGAINLKKYYSSCDETWHFCSTSLA